MPTQLSVDYAQLKSDFIKGLSLKELADLHSLNLGSLRSYAQRDGWHKLKQNSAQKVLNSAQSHVERHTMRHVDTILGYTQQAIDNIVQRGHDHKPNDLLVLATVVDKLDVIARRSLRLDTAQHSAVALQVNVNTAQPVHDRNADAQVIECQVDSIEAADNVPAQQP